MSKFNHQEYAAKTLRHCGRAWLFAFFLLFAAGGAVRAEEPGGRALMQPPPELFNARPLEPAELEDCRGGESEFSGPTGMDTAVILWDEVRTKQQSVSSVSGQSANTNVISTISGSLY